MISRRERGVGGGGGQENQYEIPSSNAVEESSGVSREGALYVDFELSYDGFIPCGVSDVAILVRSKCKTPKRILP